MRLAIRKHLGDFIALTALFVFAIGIGGYILSQQRLRFPLVEDDPFRVRVELSNAQAVQPGQGQTVRVAGVEIGQIGQIELEDGKALVDLDIEPKHEELIRTDATALLRTKTGLKDMFIEVDPGVGAPIEEGGVISSSETAPDIDQDEILAVLDTDTRDYLKLLLNAGGKGLEGRSTDLRETLRVLGPLHRDLRRVTVAVARRRQNLARLVHTYGLLTTELAYHDDDISRLVQASNATLGSFAAQDQNLSLAVSRLPKALRQTQTALAKVGPLADQLGPTLTSLRPAVRQLAVANGEVLPLAREGTPILRDQVRPFARSAQPFLRSLGLAAGDLSRAGPDLTGAFYRLNRLFNIGAYNPGGAEGLTGDLAADRARNESYLYWLAWVAQTTTGIFSTADGQGPFRRLTVGGANCSILVSGGVPQDVADLFGTAGLCAK